MVGKKSEYYCGKNNCDLYDCVYHYSNAPWDELIYVFTPTYTKDKQCKDYEKEK